MENKFIEDSISRYVSGDNQNDHIYRSDGWRCDWKNDLEPDPEIYFVRNVIVWDPILLGDIYLQCPSCSLKSILIPSDSWCNGVGVSSHKPRQIYGFQEDSLLVSRIYRCQNAHHRILAHDPGVLSQTCSFIEEPFILFHKLGLTRELYDYFIRQMHLGTSTCDSISLWHQSMYDRYLAKKRLYEKRATSLETDKCLFPIFDKKGFDVGVKLQVKCTIQDYFKKEMKYAQRMCQMSAIYLSADHTFKIAANIGIWRNGKWLEMYDSLFLVMNEVGVVMMWILCKGSKFVTVEESFTSLKKRLDQQGCDIKLIAIDNCCKWGEQLGRIFPTSKIVLDPFHALQRITMEIPKKKGTNNEIRLLRYDLTRALKLIIRQPGDSGEQRHQFTASADVIEGNVVSFLRQWQSVEVDGKKVLPEPALKSVKKLLVHVKKGCLSGIPPSFGTSRNEGIHKILAKWFRGKKIGLQQALAHLGFFFYRWNEKRLSSSRSRIVPNVEQYVQYLDGVKCAEYFGLGFRFEELSGIDLSSSCDSEIIIEEDTVGDDDCDDCVTEDLPAEEEDAVISEEEIERTLTRVDNIVSVTNHIIHLGENLRFNSNHVPLLKSALCLLANQKSETMSNLVSDIKTYNLEIVSSGDNALFTVIRYALSDVWTDELQAEFGLLDALNVRAIVIQELSGFQDLYAQFILDQQTSFSDLLLEIDSATIITSELLNCVPLAICNYLRIPVIVFTGMLNFPLIPLIPNVTMISSAPMYLGFDSVALKFLHVRRKEHDQQNDTLYSTPAPDASSKPCRCGAGAAKAKGTPSCIGVRCKCAHAGNSCRDCHCINCANPFGQREKKNANSGPATPRKRRRHSKAKPTDLQFLSRSMEENPGFKWDFYEKILLLELTRVNLDNGGLDVMGLCGVVSKLRQGVLKEKLFHTRGVEEVRKQIFAAVGIDKAYQTQLREQLHMNYR